MTSFPRSSFQSIVHRLPSPPPPPNHFQQVHHSNHPLPSKSTNILHPLNPSPYQTTFNLSSIHFPIIPPPHLPSTHFFPLPHVHATRMYDHFGACMASFRHPSSLHNPHNPHSYHPLSEKTIPTSFKLSPTPEPPLSSYPNVTMPTSHPWNTTQLRSLALANPDYLPTTTSTDSCEKRCKKWVHSSMW